MDFSIILTSAGLISLLTITLLEIILGIDNIVFLSIVVGKAPQELQKKLRFWGLFLAMFLRILMLFGIGYLVKMQSDLFSIAGFGISIKDLILLGGGLFLISKSTLEIHHKLAEAGLENDEEDKEMIRQSKIKKNVFSKLLVEILLINIIFSLDSVITAVGLTNHVPIMVVAVFISTLVMLLMAGTIANYINKNPTIIMLALSFLIMIGTLLVAEAFDIHLNRNYVYFAMSFSLIVELLNVALIKRIYGKR